MNTTISVKIQKIIKDDETKLYNYDEYKIFNNINFNLKFATETLN